MRKNVDRLHELILSQAHLVGKPRTQVYAGLRTGYSPTAVAAASEQTWVVRLSARSWASSAEIITLGSGCQGGTLPFREVIAGRAR
jgi:hypothetical protein